MKNKIGTALYVAGLCISLMFSCAIAGGGAACMITEGVSFKYVLITIVSIIIAFTSFESFDHIFDDPVNIEVVYGTQPKSEAAEQSNHVDNDATYGGAKLDFGETDVLAKLNPLKTMTQAEIEKELGYKIKIVEDDNN